MRGWNTRALLLATAAAAALAAPHAATADAVADRRAPSVGYVYPAGGRQGTAVVVLAGGQNLRGATAAHVSGDGVTAEVLRYVRPLSFQQQAELRRRVAAIRKARRDALVADDTPRRRSGKRERPRKSKGDEKAAKPTVVLPTHPLLDRLDELSDRDLDGVIARFIGVERRKKQPNAQIAETVELQVEIAPGAAPGYREIRLETRAGLTNPVRFQVGTLPEVSEVGLAVRGQPLTSTPVVVNGQILPGQVDRFRFDALRGQRLVVAAAARDLVPFLADTVPGWFQATVCLRDAAGREVGFSDDRDFEPDPRLVVDVPHDGEYVVEIRDALYRGREDFVYRLSVSDAAPRTWSAATAGVADGPAPEAALQPEVEPNDSAVAAQGLLPPQVVAGRISRPGDRDHYVFDGRRGDDLVLEVSGRRMGSPIDPVLRLRDHAGAVVAWSDDFEDGAPGLLTHHADCYLRVRLPADGAYSIEVADVRGHGSARHDYRLRVGPPRPDFQVAVTPSSVTVPSGRSVPLRVHVLRRDGFDGEIELRLAGAPPGFELAGARVPAGSDSVRMTLRAPRSRRGATVPLRLEALARVGGRELRHAVLPADDRMQAFILRHLVPAQELLVAVRRGPPAAGARIVGDVPVLVGPERPTRVEFRIPGLKPGSALEARLDDPPPGIAVCGTEIRDGALVLLLTSTGDAAPVADNLIAEVFATAQDGTARSVGYLPAIPIETQGAADRPR